MSLRNKKLQNIFKKRRKNNLNVIDLFSGCGGLSFGFQLAGFNIKAAVDFDKDSLETIRHNKVSENALNIDLFQKDWIKELEQHISLDDIDVVIGGPPCQGFSLTGPRQLSDKRNKLYKGMLDLVKKTKPSAFLIENVKGMATLYKGKVKEEIVSTFTELGYTVSTKILNSKFFGVPQARERLFYVGILKGEFIFPKSIFDDEELITCREALSDLPSLIDLAETHSYNSNPKSEYQDLIRGKTEVLSNHEPTRHTEEVINVISQVPEGGNHKDLPPGVGESRKFNEAWTRYDGNKPSRTIDTGHRNHFHYEYNRVPTVRENCRLQSFPDYFKVLGTKTSQNKQIGNAVPVLLAKILAEQIHEQIKGN